MGLGGFKPFQPKASSTTEVGATEKWSLCFLKMTEDESFAGIHIRIAFQLKHLCYHQSDVARK